MEGFLRQLLSQDKDLKWQDMAIARTADTVKRKKVVHYLIIILSHFPVMRPLGPKEIYSHYYMVQFEKPFHSDTAVSLMFACYCHTEPNTAVLLLN